MKIEVEPLSVTKTPEFTVINTISYLTEGPGLGSIKSSTFNSICKLKFPIDA